MTENATRTCIITGANSGIGKCAAQQIAAQGLRVVMACRNMVQAKTVCAQIRAQTGNNAVFARPVDLSLVKNTRQFAKEFLAEFATAEMVCVPENLFEDGEWAILEWRDPLGLRGCGFFHVVDDKIVFQRGYWDKLSFLRQHGLPIE